MLQVSKTHCYKWLTTETKERTESKLQFKKLKQDLLFYVLGDKTNAIIILLKIYILSLEWMSSFCS